MELAKTAVWAAIFLFVGVAASAAEQGWLSDQHVVVTPPQARIRDDAQQPVDTVHAGTVLDVLAIEGERVRVNRGWLQAQDVIPYHQAIEHFTKEIDRQPSAIAYAARARVWCYHGEYDKALADCNEALKIDPESAIAYSRRGRAWAGKGELETAVADFDEALRLDPEDAHAYTHRARARNELGEYEQAVKDCNEALKLDPKSNVAYYYRGRAWALRGDIDQAIADFSRSLALNPRYVPAHNSRANEYYLQRKFKEAIADYDEAIRLNPQFDMVHIHYNRGNAYFHMGDYEQAVADYRESLEHNARYLPAIEALAQCYARLGDFAAAAQWQAKALAAAPSGNAQAVMQARLNRYQAGQRSGQNGAAQTATSASSR
ncbi:MAG TPA: tetratricopeptide repeat protein [Pirellulales bacterium]|nr:tetratricopeptide repeat protein [Pirellulales bacterium]